MKDKCENSCTYSRAMGQPYPRLCVHCGHPHPEEVDEINKKSGVTVTTNPVAQLILVERKYAMPISDAYEVHIDKDDGQNSYLFSTFNYELANRIVKSYNGHQALVGALEFIKSASPIKFNIIEETLNKHK